MASGLQSRDSLREEIRRDLAARYPSLHLFVSADGSAEVRGTFPVIGADEEVLDSFQVAILLPERFPEELPITREVGGRIPWIADRHIYDDGCACVLMPDERWKVFPVGMPFIKYLEGPLHSFFLSQVAHEAGEKWPFGEWAHGVYGIIDYFFELVGTREVGTLVRYLDVLRCPSFEDLRLCPCGSGKRLRSCCSEAVADMRRKSRWTSANAAYCELSLMIAQHRLLTRLLSRNRFAAKLMAISGTARSVA